MPAWRCGPTSACSRRRLAGAQIAHDGLLDEGYARAAPLAAAGARSARQPSAPNSRRCNGRQAALGKEPVARAGGGRLRATINPAGVAQPACTLCGDCCGGCNVGAKNTVALTYLPDAARHGAEIFTHAKVRHVAKARRGRLARVALRAAGRDAGAAASVTADIVVLAAGTLGSTEILLRSREHGLAVSDRLGRSFSANGDIIAFGYGAKLPVNAIGVGHPAKVDGLESARAFRARSRSSTSTTWPSSLTIQEGVMPSALAPMLPALFIPNGRLLGALQEPDQPASTRGRSRACRRSSPCRTTAPRAGSCWRTTG